MRAATGLTIALLAAVGCSGSADKNATGDKPPRAELASNTPEDALSEEIVPEGAPPSQLLAAKAKKYAHGMVPEGATISGNLAEGGRNDYLSVLRGTYCYRVIGVGGDGVQDLDLVLYDPNGVELQQDPAEDRFPVLGIGSDICPVVAGAYRIQVQMFKGSGTYAVGVYRTP